MSTETTKKKIKIDNGTEFAKVYTDKQTDSKLTAKQDKLVSGTNIKTINGNSLLGSGDLTIESGGSDVAEIILSDSQMVEINKNKITFTEAQFNIIKQASYIKFMYNDNEVISGVVNFFSTAEIYTISCFFISLDGLRATLMYIPTNYDYSQLNISIVSIVYDIKLNMGGDNSFYVWFNEEQANYPIYFDTINGKSILHTDSTINEYTIPDTKTISLFGNHSILVHKDSTDTNIDLYNHAIEISGTTSGNYDYSIWFNVVSSKNLVVDSLTDLKTLLGNTFKREVFGFSNTSTTPTAIIGIDETQMYNTNGETTSFANLSSITFTDTVTTI